MGEKELSEAIQGHGSAIENGLHHQRDTSLGEDRCRVRNRGAAEVMAMFRNLAIALHGMERERGRPPARSLKAWMRRQTFGKAHALLKR